MKLSTGSRIEANLRELLDKFANERHWTTSQAIEIIIAQFFNYELSDNAG